MKKVILAIAAAATLLSCATTLSVAQGAPSSADCAATSGALASPVRCLAFIATLPPAQQQVFFTSLPETVRTEVAQVEGFSELGLAAGSDEPIAASPTG